MEINNYEKGLCQPDNMMLAPIILTSLKEDAYYISKSGEKVYVIGFSDAEQTWPFDLITVAIREEDGETVGYASCFKDSILKQSVYEDHPELLPADCPTNIDMENIRAPKLLIIKYDGEKIRYIYDETTVEFDEDEEFDANEYLWWANLGMNIHFDMECRDINKQ